MQTQNVKDKVGMAGKQKTQHTKTHKSKHALIPITHTLVKFSVASSGHVWLITTINTSNVITLDLFDLVHGNVPSEWNLTHTQVKDNH